jgi:hypothetical protein
LNIINSVTNANNAKSNKVSTMNNINSLSNNNNSGLNDMNLINNYKNNNTVKNFLFLQNITEWSNHEEAMSKDQEKNKKNERMDIKESGNPPI